MGSLKLGVRVAMVLALLVGASLTGSSAAQDGLKNKVVVGEDSYIDTLTAVNDHIVIVSVPYTTTGAGYTIGVQVYDENLGDWKDAFLPGGSSTFVTTGPGTGTVTFYYYVPVRSAWGEEITNGTFAQALCEATMSSAIGIVSSDSQWVYVP